MRDYEAARQIFFGATAGNIVISLIFLGGRLIDGMPFFEAFGKFFFAVLLTAFLTAAVMGAGLFLGEMISSRKGK